MSAVEADVVFSVAGWLFHWTIKKYFFMQFVD